MPLDSKAPGGPLQEKWDRRRFELKLVNPANKRKYEIIVVGTGLAGFGQTGIETVDLSVPALGLTCDISRY